jgi:WD40 repeat protein
MSRWLLVLLLATLCEPLSAAPPITAIAVTPDGNSVVTGSQVGVEIRSLPDLHVVDALKTEMHNVHDLAYSPDGRMLAVGGGIPGKRGVVELYSWPERKLLRGGRPHRDCIHRIAWRSDSQSLLTASADKTVGVIQADSAKLIRLLEGHSRGVLAIAYLPGDSEIISAGIDETIRIWNAKTGEPIRTLTNHTRAVLDLAVRPITDEHTTFHMVTAGEDRTVRLWDPNIGRLIRFARLDAVPLAVAWTRNARQILVACKDGRLLTLDPETMKVVDNRPCINGIAYCLSASADGGVLVGGQDGQVQRLNLK